MKGTFIWLKSAKDRTGKGVAGRFNDPMANLGFPRYTQGPRVAELHKNAVGNCPFSVSFAAT